MVQLIGAKEEKLHVAAVNTRVEERFYVVTEHFFDSGRRITTRYPVARVAWVTEVTEERDGRA